MRALKITVVVLSLALLGGFGLLVFGLSQNWHRLGEAPRADIATPRSWGEVNLRQAAGTRVLGVTASGNLVLLQVEDASGAGQRLLVLDPARGAVIGTFVVGGP